MSQLLPAESCHVADFTLNYCGTGSAADDAIICNGTVTTYAQLDIMVGDASAALQRMNLGKGAVVASWSPPCVELIVLQLAALAAGLRVVHIEPNYPADEVAELLRHYEVHLIVVRASHQGIQFPALIRAMRPYLPHLQTVVVHGRQARFEHVLPGGWSSFQQSARDKVPGADQTGNQVRVVAGDIWFADQEAPGGVYRYALNLHRVAAADELPFDANDRLYLGIAPYIPGGMLWGCLSAIANGVTIILPDPDTHCDESVGKLDMRGCSVALLPNVATPAESHQRHGKRRVASDVGLPCTSGQDDCVWVRATGSRDPFGTIIEA